MVQGDTILQGGGAVLANRAVAWLGALSLNATAPDQAASPAVARFVADFMAPGDPAHPGDFVLTSGGLLGILKNGYVYLSVHQMSCLAWIVLFTIVMSHNAQSGTLKRGLAGLSLLLSLRSSLPNF